MPEAAALPSLAQAIGWVGGPLADLEGEQVGEVQSVYIDSTEQRAGLAGGEPGGGRRGAAASSPCRSTSAPAPPSASGSAARASGSRGAPVVDPARPLLREHELTICEHFGISEDVGRAAEVAGRAEGAITAIPPA